MTSQSYFAQILASNGILIHDRDDLHGSQGEVSNMVVHMLSLGLHGKNGRESRESKELAPS